MLESNSHSDNSFVTLTYADDYLPHTSPSCSPSMATLEPKHLQDWLKRLRKRIEPMTIRFYAVGEYGDETERPHYHAAIFGIPSCQRGTTKAQRKGTAEVDPETGKGLYNARSVGSCCGSCDLVQDTWPHGRVYLGELSQASAQYIAGYVTKKMTMNDDPRLMGRHPEFARMSLRPGIGANFVPHIAETLDRYAILEREDDVPSSLRHGKKYWPLGRYLVGRLRQVTMGDHRAPQSTIQKIQAEVSDVRKAAFDNSESFEVALQRKMKPMADRNRAKAKIFKPRKTI